jgi:ABC-type antimicrobial peptide transport system permease subunit
MRIAPGGNPGITPADRREFFGRLLTKAQAVPGVERAALAGGLPLDFPAGIKLAQGDGSLNSLARVITPEYFRILSMSLLRGRAFSDADAADRPRVAIVNENLARALFGDQNPVGRRLTLIADAGAAIPAGSLEIVGLARNVKELGIDEIPFNDVYLPFAQNPPRSMYVVMKTSGAAVAAKGVLRAELHALDADGVLSDAATMEERIHDGLRGARFHLAMAAIFATLAVLLAAVGVYGAVAFSTAQRTGEFALRMALGARPSSLLRLMFSHTVRLTGAGALAGMGVALILGELLKSALYLAPHLHSGLIYGVAVHDPLLLGGAVALLLAIAALAALVPAARAMRIDPCQALRQE